jgi:hypothetical protein
MLQHLVATAEQELVALARQSMDDETITVAITFTSHKEQA